jgi:hypothetical protein
MASVKITFTTHLPSARPERQGQMDTLIMYSVDGGAPDNLTLPDANPTDAEVQREITEQVKRGQELSSKTFTVE